MTDWAECLGGTQLSCFMFASFTSPDLSTSSLLYASEQRCKSQVSTTLISGQIVALWSHSYWQDPLMLFIRFIIGLFFHHIYHVNCFNIVPNMWCLSTEMHSAWDAVHKFTVWLLHPYRLDCGPVGWSTLLLEETSFTSPLWPAEAPADWTNWWGRPAPSLV